MSNTIIGIPHYKDLEGLVQVYTSIKNTTEQDYDMVILNSGDELKLDIHAEIINTPIEGPLKAYNRLFQIAKDRKKDLFLTQTDVYFPKIPKRDWLDECIELSKRQECGLVTCVGGGGTSGPDFINGFPWVGAWFIYIPYRTIEKLGGYDENIPLGWGVDIDYTYAVIKNKLNVYTINYWVDHHPDYVNNHEHEHVDNIEQLKKDAFTYMRNKWKVGEFRE